MCRLSEPSFVRIVSSLGLHTGWEWQAAAAGTSAGVAQAAAVIDEPHVQEQSRRCADSAVAAAACAHVTMRLLQL